jgi:hypothetical protein
MLVLLDGGTYIYGGSISKTLLRVGCADTADQTAREAVRPPGAAG